MRAADDRITSFPAKLVKAVGSIQDLNEPVVIFSAFGENREEWNDNFASDINLMESLQLLFTHATDKDGKLVTKLSTLTKTWKDSRATMSY